MEDYQTSVINTLLEGDFFVQVGLQSLPDNKKADIISKMTETVNARVFASIWDQLSDTDQQTMRELEAKDLVDFLKPKGIEIINLLVEEAMKHRLEVIMMYQSVLNPV